MMMELSAEELAFRDEVRAFIAGNLPDAQRQKVEKSQHLTRDDFLAWHKILHTKGWIAPG